jgi:beta-lactamase class C
VETSAEKPAVKAAARRRQKTVATYFHVEATMSYRYFRKCLLGGAVLLVLGALNLAALPPAKHSGAGGAPSPGAQAPAAGGVAMARRAMGGWVQSGVIIGGVAAIYENGHANFVSVGNKSTDDPTPPDADTVYEIGSVTKVFTSTFLAKAVDDGKIALNDPIDSHLPTYAHLRPEVQGKITFERLGTFTASLPRKQPPRFTTAQEILGQFLSHWTPHTPIGSADKYSNLSYEMLAFLAPQIEHTTYDHLLSNFICNPLGMTHTHPDTEISGETNRAYGVDQGGHKTTYKRASWDGVGFITSTASDMENFLEACIGVTPGSPKLQQALALATKPYFPMANGQQQGLAWVIHKESSPSGSVTLISKDGIADGLYSLIAFDPEAKSGVVFLTNRDDSKASKKPQLYPLATRLLTGVRPAGRSGAGGSAKGKGGRKHKGA